MASGKPIKIIVSKIAPIIVSSHSLIYEHMHIRGTQISALLYSQSRHDAKAVVPHVQTLDHGVQYGVVQLSYVLFAAVKFRDEALEVCVTGHLTNVGHQRICRDGHGR